MRDIHISKIKGIGICLMVLGHALWLGPLRDIIYLFYMPLFFITTGYLFKETWLCTPTLYVKNQFRKQYWVYVKWCLFFLLLHNVFMYLGVMNEFYGYKGLGYEPYSWIQLVKKAIRIIVFMDGNEPLLAGFWFVKTLFVATTLLCCLRATLKYILNKFNIHSFYINMILSIVMLLALLFSFYFFTIKTIFVEPKEIIAMIFLLFGMLLHKIKKYSSLIVICFNGTFVLVYISFGAVNMFAETFAKALEILLTGTIGWVFIYKVSNISCKIDTFLAYCGDHSLQILIWHLLCFKIPTLLYLYVTNKDINKISAIPNLQIENIPYMLLCTLAGIILPLFICKVLNNFLIIKRLNHE